MRRLDAMCRDLPEPLEPAANASVAKRLARAFPLVHRSVTPGGPSLEAILGEGALLARAPCTKREVKCGIDRALYFFLGCAAYPEGVVAFLVGNRILDRQMASYTRRSRAARRTSRSRRARRG